jgi:hypothetical protein
MTGLETRWARDVLSAFAPKGAPGLAPAENEVDYVSVLARMRRDATPAAAFGLRIAVWMAALAPLWLWGKLATLGKLAVPHRAQLLRELLHHRLFAVRELTTLLKLSAAMALLGAPSVRARSGYDHAPPAAEVESGLRVRLPLATEPRPPLKVWPAHDGASAPVELPLPPANEGP